jgi:hypothetical protein
MKSIQVTDSEKRQPKIKAMDNEEEERKHTVTLIKIVLSKQKPELEGPGY